MEGCAGSLRVNVIGYILVRSLMQWFSNWGRGSLWGREGVPRES